MAVVFCGHELCPPPVLDVVARLLSVRGQWIGIGFCMTGVMVIVKILKNCKKAIPPMIAEGKMIILDMDGRVLNASLDTILGPSNLLDPNASFAQMWQKMIVSPIVSTPIFSKVPEKKKTEWNSKFGGRSSGIHIYLVRLNVSLKLK
ncbi:hypothetical protein Zm00014a_035529 [Zea mays]|uniref:Uncharacterized protein n=1 Tax=Zea mays TaxID=4577 RepID=A0A3L6FQG9_MAIZE|nr:hypothetical protein Zm00014a_035529 [Zea mays]